MRPLIFLICLFFSGSIFAQDFSSNMANKTLNEFFLVSSEIMNKTIIADSSIDGRVKVFQVHFADSYLDVFTLVLKSHNLIFEEYDNVYYIKPDVNSLSFFFPFFDSVDNVYITSYRLSKYSNDLQSVDVDFKLLSDNETFYVSDRSLSAFNVYVLFIDSCLVKLTRNRRTKFITCEPVSNDYQQTDFSTVDIDDSIVNDKD